jgi:hypothetical protein
MYVLEKKLVQTVHFNMYIYIFFYFQLSNLMSLFLHGVANLATGLPTLDPQGTVLTTRSAGQDIPCLLRNL